MQVPSRAVVEELVGELLLIESAAERALESAVAAARLDADVVDAIRRVVAKDLDEAAARFCPDLEALAEEYMRVCEWEAAAAVQELRGAVQTAVGTVRRSGADEPTASIVARLIEMVRDTYDDIGTVVASRTQPTDWGWGRRSTRADGVVLAVLLEWCAGFQRLRETYRTVRREVHDCSGILLDICPRDVDPLARPPIALRRPTVLLRRTSGRTGGLPLVDGGQPYSTVRSAPERVGYVVEPWRRDVRTGWLSEVQYYFIPLEEQGREEGRAPYDPALRSLFRLAWCLCSLSPHSRSHVPELGHRIFACPATLRWQFAPSGRAESVMESLTDRDDALSLAAAVLKDPVSENAIVVHPELVLRAGNLAESEHPIGAWFQPGWRTPPAFRRDPARAAPEYLFVSPFFNGRQGWVERPDLSQMLPPPTGPGAVPRRPHRTMARVSPAIPIPVRLHTGGDSITCLMLDYNAMGCCLLIPRDRPSDELQVYGDTLLSRLERSSRLSVAVPPGLPWLWGQAPGSVRHGGEIRVGLPQDPGGGGPPSVLVTPEWERGARGVKVRLRLYPEVRTNE
jgi:hypothetical protein